MNAIQHYCPVRRVGTGKKHHFFGYYNKHPWSASGRYLLAQQVDMFSADLSGVEPAEVGVFDLEDNDRFQVIGVTTAWNWQMGSQQQWLQGLSGNQIIYNTRASAANSPSGDFRSIVHSLDSGKQRELPLPVYVVAPNSEYALCVNYSRFQLTHPTIGYIATGNKSPLGNAPNSDGIYRMEIDSGKSTLLLSLLDLRNFQPCASMDKAIHWVTHMEINPNSSRLLFIHRWTERVEDETCFLHRLFTMNPDGTNLQLLECTDHPLPQLRHDFDASAVATFAYEKSIHQISHPAWKNDDQVIVWGPHDGAIHYHLYDTTAGTVTVVGENCLIENGHMTYSANGKWLLSDTYPDDVSNERLLILYDVENDQRYDIGTFYTDPNLGKQNRCDLHPRLSPDGLEVCIDSVHEHVRQMYIVDVSVIVT